MAHKLAITLVKTILLIVGMAITALPQELKTTGSPQDCRSDIRGEIENLKNGQAAIQAELQAIKALIQKSQPASTRQLNVRNVEFELGNNPVRGNEAAKLVLVDFTDYQCPFCGRYARETLPQIMKQYVDSGKIRYVIVDVPLPIHKMAPKAAEAALCAKEQGKFWEMHDQMMSKQDSLDSLSTYASSLSLNMPQFEDCLTTNKYADQVGKDISLARQLGISGVPGFILASGDPTNALKLKGIDAITGAQPLSSFQKIIDLALSPTPK